MAETRPQQPALRFTALELRRFLGLQRRGQAVRFAAGELSPGVTLIAGPNGSGKTTTARAIEAVLWPESAADPLADVGATLEADGIQWTAELAGSTRRWLRRGAPVVGPVYCAATDRDRYRLALHELLTADDRELAAGIRRELGGGYSVSDAAQRLGFSAEPGVPRKGAQRLRQAQEAVAAASLEQAALRRREAELAALRTEEAAARQADDQRQVVSSLLNWREAGRRLLAARRQAAAFDPRIAALRGTESEQLLALRQEEKQAEAACTAAAAALTAADTALAARRALRPLPAPDVLTRCRALTQQIQQAENDVRRARAELDGAQAREQSARTALAERLTPEQLGRLDRLQPDQDLAEAVRAAAEAAVAGGVLDHFRGLPVLADPSADPATLETCRRGMGVLRAWLQEAAPCGAVAAGALSRGPFLVAAAGTLLALVLAAVLHWVLLVPGAVLAVLTWWLRPRRIAEAPVSRRPALEADFARLGLPLPAAWTTDAVARVLEDLAMRWSWESARARLLAEGSAVRTVLEKAAADRNRALDACRERLTTHLGCRLDGTPLAVFHLVTRIASWQEARDLAAEVRRRAEAASEALAGLLARLAADLAACGMEPLADGATAAAVVEGLEKAQAESETAARERDQRVQALADKRRVLADSAGRRRDLLLAVGLRAEEAEHADELLGQWTALRPMALEALKTAHAAAAAVERCRDDAQRARARGSALQSLRTPQLALRQGELERSAARREQLVREIESTETLVREAKRRHDLEQRLAERDEAMLELARDRDAGWRAIAGQCCADLVASRLELQASGVLHRAQELFAAITRGRYRLLADEVSGGAVFRARDAETEQVHDLASLSSGTRLQLLLAARLAFIAEKEGDGPMLPLVLDEVLGNSDDERAGTIIDAVLAAARAGRQVLCLTAQADEVGKWQSRLKSAGVPFSICWLPQGAATPPAVDLAPVPAPAVPAPQDGEPMLDYARRLGVPALDPFDHEAGSLHLWYLVDEPRVLHALLQAGYRTWGPLSLLFRQDGVAAGLLHAIPGLAGLDPKRLAARAEMVMLVLALVRVGNGRPLGRAGLAASGAVSDRYAEEVGQLLDTCRGEARELLQRLEAGTVRGFRRRSVDELAQWLAEHGYTDARAPLSVDEIRARLHAQAAPHLAVGVLTMDDVRALLRLAESLRKPAPASPASAVVPTTRPPQDEVIP